MNVKDQSEGSGALREELRRLAVRCRDAIDLIERFERDANRNALGPMRVAMTEVYETFIATSAPSPTTDDMKAPPLFDVDAAKNRREKLLASFRQVLKFSPGSSQVDALDLETLSDLLSDLTHDLQQVIWYSNEPSMCSEDALWACQFQFWNDWGANKLLLALVILHSVSPPQAVS